MLSCKYEKYWSRSGIQAFCRFFQKANHIWSLAQLGHPTGQVARHPLASAQQGPTVTLSQQGRGSALAPTGETSSHELSPPTYTAASQALPQEDNACREMLVFTQTAFPLSLPTQWNPQEQLNQQLASMMLPPLSPLNPWAWQNRLQAGAQWERTAESQTACRDLWVLLSGREGTASGQPQRGTQL